MSLFVLHHATEFGVRPAWAAGVRQRLTQQKREFLEQIHSFSSVPLSWISRLTTPQTAQAALQRIAELAPIDRLPTLALPEDIPLEARRILQGIAERRTWTAEEKAELISHYGQSSKPSPSALDILLDTWTTLAENGEKYLEALQEYYLVFFAEEEAQIRPALARSLAEAQILAGQLQLVDLVERLSHGVRLENLDSIDELTLFPSWWVTPLAFLTRPGKGKVLIAFGARPEVRNETEGAEPATGLVNAIKSLGDPTRLRILRFLSNEPLTPTELAHRLRLRPPTVIHHLRILRLANLVKVTVGENMEKLYTARLEAIQTIQKSLADFLDIHD
jgi:DNA-binding transcriptional ArsR family regulator